MFYVYEHWRPDMNTCFYVGKGRGKRAFSPHNRNRHWKNIVGKLEAASLSFEVRFIFTELIEDDAFLKEQELILHWRRFGGLANISDGGEGRTGFKHSEETRLLISIKGKGRTPSEKTRALLSKSRLGNKNTLGHKLSEEHKRKISERNRGENNPNYGRVFGIDVRDRMRQAHLGKTLPIEQIEKIVAKNKGKKRSEETKRRLSEAAKAQWDRYRAQKSISGQSHD
jgi:hypothetical protein